MEVRNQAEKALEEIVQGTFSAKSVKSGFGHDNNGMSLSVYIGKKKVFTLEDDGYGGEPIVEFQDDKSEQVVKDFIKDKNVAKVMFSNGYGFMGSPDRIREHDAIVMIAETLFYVHEKNNAIKKIMRKTKSKLVYGNDERYFEVGYKGVKDLSELLKFNNGRKVLQRDYNEIKGKLVSGDRIFNTEEQLESLGIVR